MKGLGTRLLNELQKRVQGKEIYLFTDSACTYQFYEKRGFQRQKEKKISLKLPNKKIDLQCMLYSKVIDK
ncbi:GNAT family N-acetyltransferase [Enterococcus gallinarum]|nr:MULTISPECIES: GNAT family N-acetyltransferase [Enterococcus]MCI5686872.1 GNAT family N-acetyltransferase [Enterococcus gallinarum]MEB5855141.1 GNAT family N-acetyltransferase [Enterococcus gallinarum]MEB5880509.1 GNAT family N-acetyltransferase [Enterococcus gallinarum]MEB5967457.1 GNAT family N-acetyltransferase [Enterococcus gallinarum]MEB6038321.1 GNAT family N-acetyltransferase [Enterococcus gallinarum]